MLNLIHALKQQFTNINGGKVKQIDIKNRTYYFDNDVINLDEFDGSKVNVGKKDFHDIDTYYLGYDYKKIITECDEINSVNHLYLRIKDMKGYFEKSKNNNEWYLTINGDGDVLKKYASFFKSIRA